VSWDNLVRTAFGPIDAADRTFAEFRGSCESPAWESTESLGASLEVPSDRALDEALLKFHRHVSSMTVYGLFVLGNQKVGFTA